MRIFGFGLPHHILEMPVIPRERDKLRQALGKARAQRRKSNLSRWAAVNLLAWALIVSLWWNPYGVSGSIVVPQPAQERVYLPLVIAE